MLTRQIKRIRRALFAAAIAVTAALLSIAFEADDTARVYFFDVGQGDAIGILLPHDRQIVIDGGPSDALLAKLGRHIPWYDREIEYVILTHPHSDHVTGLAALAGRYRIGTFIYNGIDRYDLPVFATLMERLKEQGTAIVRVAEPARYGIAENTRFDVLFPDAPLGSEARSDYNAGSLVTRLAYHDQTFLFMGDAPRTTELHLLETGAWLAADVLKVGHQGSKTSSDPAFIEAVHPSYAVITVGKNDYGHPHYRTLRTLRDSGAEVVRTDLSGDIGFIADGSGIELLNLEKIRR